MVVWGGPTCRPEQPALSSKQDAAGAVENLSDGRLVWVGCPPSSSSWGVTARPPCGRMCVPERGAMVGVPVPVVHCIHNKCQFPMNKLLLMHQLCTATAAQRQRAHAPAPVAVPLRGCAPAGCMTRSPARPQLSCARSLGAEILCMPDPPQHFAVGDQTHPHDEHAGPSHAAAAA